MSDTPTPKTDAECADIHGDAFMSKCPIHGDWVSSDFARQLEREMAEAKDWKSIKVTRDGETHPLGTLLEMLESELTAHKAQHVRDEADYNELEADYRDSIAKHVERVEKLEAIITAHKAVLTKSYNTLEEIVSSPFYQRSCKGGEMERLMNQAIESLSAVTPNQSPQ